MHQINLKSVIYLNKKYFKWHNDCNNFIKVKAQYIFTKNWFKRKKNEMFFFFYLLKSEPKIL